MALRGTKRKNRVYEGRFKGSTETHIPNDVMRENYDQMEWGSMEPVTCDKCGLVSRVHRLELKIWRCPCERSHD
jgi:ribosomal protein L37AE/L43A